MKRVLSLIFVLCMCLSCFGGFAAYAEGGAQIKASAVNGFAGEEATVQISIENNPGIARLKIKVSYDAEVLTLKGSASAGLMEGFTPSPNFDVNPYVLTWTQAGNCAADGVLGTMTFEIKDGAAIGANALTVTIEEVMNQTFEELSASFTAVNGSVTVKEPASAITSANVALGDTIAMNYYVDLYPGHAGAQMKFTMNEKEVLVDGVATGKPYEYKYTFTGITPQCMGDTVLAELIYDGNTLASKEYSVLQNLQDLNGKTAAQLGYTDAQLAAMKTLIADLREYGAAAQVYTGHNDSALVNVGNSGATAFVAPDPETSEKDLVTENESDVFHAISAGVWFDYNNAIYVKFLASGIDTEKFKVSVVELDEEYDEVSEVVEYTTANEELTLVSAEDSIYQIMFGVAPVNFDTIYRINLYQKPKSWKLYQEVYYSVNSYVISIVNNDSADDTMKDLAKTLYNYGLAADAFVNSFNG